MLRKKQDLFNPVKTYWKEIKYKNNEVYEQCNTLLSNNKLINHYNKYIDQACFHSVIEYTNLNVCVFLNICRSDCYDFYVTYLKTTHILYGIKTIFLDKNTFINALYQLKYQYITDYDDLIQKMEIEYPFLKDMDKTVELNVCMLVNRGTHEIDEDLNKKKYSYIIGQEKDDKQLIASLFYCDASLEVCRKQKLQEVLL